MSLSVGEIIVRRKLEKNEEGLHEHYIPGQFKAIAVEDKAVLSWCDNVGRLIIMACHKVEEAWVLVKPAHVISIGLNGQMDIIQFAPSYKFGDAQVNALNEAVEAKEKKRKKPKSEEDE